ncbi:hypothetical protein D9M72_435520 [compost metagenome]
MATELMLPMSVDTITSSGMAFSSSRRTWRGCRYWPPVGVRSCFCSSIMSRLYGSRSWVQSSSSFSHAAFSLAISVARASRVASQASVRPARRWLSATAAALASPQMPTEIFFTRPSILWSASIWMILAFLGQ